MVAWGSHRVNSRDVKDAHIEQSMVGLETDRKEDMTEVKNEEKKITLEDGILNSNVSSCEGKQEVKIKSGQRVKFSDTVRVRVIETGDQKQEKE